MVKNLIMNNLINYGLNKIDRQLASENGNISRGQDNSKTPLPYIKPAVTYKVRLYVNNREGGIYVICIGSGKDYTERYEDAEETLKVFKKVGYEGHIEEIQR